MQNSTEHPIGLRFIRWGEPLLHRKLTEYFKIAKSKGFLVHLNTNGSLLNREYIAELLDIGIDSIKFSLQGVDEKTYEEMRQKGSFAQLIENIKLMYEMRGDALLPYIHIATTTTYESEEQRKEFKEFVSPYCDFVTVGKTKLEFIDVEKTSLKEEQKHKLLELKLKQRDDLMRPLVCAEVFGKISVNWNGDVTACCSDFDGKMIIGNLNENSIVDIFHGDKVKNYRKLLKDNRFDDILHCRECFDWMDVTRR